MAKDVEISETFQMHFAVRNLRKRSGFLKHLTKKIEIKHFVKAYTLFLREACHL